MCTIRAAAMALMLSTNHTLDSIAHIGVVFRLPLADDLATDPLSVEDQQSAQCLDNRESPVSQVIS